MVSSSVVTGAASSRPAIAGRGDRRRRWAGRGRRRDTSNDGDSLIVTLFDPPASATKLKLRGPFHHPPLAARATDGPPPPLSWGRIKLSRSLGAIFRPSRQINRFKIRPERMRGFFSSSLRSVRKRKRNADRRWSYLRTGRCGARPVSCPSPICGGGFRGGTL